MRRAEHSSTVVGDYIYVDGGQFSQIVDDDYLLNIGKLFPSPSHWFIGWRKLEADQIL